MARRLNTDCGFGLGCSGRIDLIRQERRMLCWCHAVLYLDIETNPHLPGHIPTTELKKLSLDPGMMRLWW